MLTSTEFTKRREKKTARMMLKIVQPSTGGARLSFVHAQPSLCTALYTILTSFLFIRFLLSWRGYVRPSFFIARILLMIVRPSFGTVRHRPYQMLRTPPCGHVRLSFYKVRPSLDIVRPSFTSSFFCTFVCIFIILSHYLVFVNFNVLFHSV